MRLSARSARRRYLILHGLRWFPTGVMLPVFVMIMLDRGLSLAEIGLVSAAQAIIVVLLELPTGGLADALGRRPVLLLASLFDLASFGLMLGAHDVVAFAVVWGLQGIYRALESGPLEAWFVDALLHADPAADVERNLAGGGVVIGLAMALGAVTSSVLVATAPLPGVDPLLVPIIALLALRVVDITAIAILMTEVRQARGVRAVRASVRAVPRVVTEALRLIRRSPALAALVTVELLWGAGMNTFELLMPARLAELLGGEVAAAALLGPVAAGAWVASAAGAAAVPALIRLCGGRPSAAGAALRIAQGLAVAGMAIGGGAAGLIVAYGLIYVIHGASNPVHYGLVHRAVGAEHRTTVVSANGLTSRAGGAVGAIGLGALAQTTSIPVAMVVGGIVLAAAAPLYRFTRNIGHMEGARRPAGEPTVPAL